ncbi:MAG: hypothetical protein HYR67_12560 [Bacteroidetes bacterium]|nr:hypothetical protein [Bacteroidota bacterium]
MDNRCFIIMPPGEPSGYSQGHFNRVYDYVIVPACRAAGYWPTRSDSVTYDNPLDVVKNIIDSEVVLCDLSANNSNALYGLAVRHSLDLPVTVVKDVKSVVMFDANAFGLLEYDESLRIDTVQKEVEILGEALKKAVETKKARHQLLDRLSIGLPQFTSQNAMVEDITPSPAPIEQSAPEEEPRHKEPRLPIISPLPEYVGNAFTEEQIGKLKAGDSLFHLNHGKGKVNFVKNSGKEKLASIQFDSGTKLLVLVASDFFRKVNK